MKEPNRTVVIQFALVTLACILAYGWNLYDLAVSYWLHEPNYSHGILVPFIAGVILYQRRSMIASLNYSDTPTHGVGLGLVGLLATLALRSWFYHRNEQWFENAPFLPAYFFGLAALGGWTMVRWAWPGVLFLVFMLPFPGKLDMILAQPLQTLAALGSEILLQAVRVPILREGNTLLVNGQQLEVARACSGLSMMLSLTCLVAAAAVLVEQRSVWQRLLLLVCAIPIALLSNVLRITVTALCYQVWSSAIVDQYAHDFAGFLMMPVGLALVVGLLGLLNRLFVVTEVQEDPARRAPKIPLLTPGPVPGIVGNKPNERSGRGGA